MVDLQKGLTAHWSMDDRDTQGGTCRDRSAFGHEANLNGSPTTGAAGVINQAYSLDGTDDYLNVPESGQTGLNTRQSVTLSVWVNLDSVNTGSKQCVWEEGGVTNGANIYEFGGNLYMGMWCESQGWSGTWFSTSVTTGTWYHAVLTLDSASTLTGYVDNTQIGQDSTNPTQLDGHSGDAAIGAVDSDTKFHDGDHSQTLGNYLDGQVDDMRIYDVPFTTAEVNALYNQRSPWDATNPLAKGLAGRWTLDDRETQGGTTRDRSAYGRHGTLNGGVTTGVSGKIGEGFSFDGSDDIVNVGNNLPQSSPLTICGWIYIDSNHGSTEACVIGNYDGNGLIFRTRPDNTDEIELWFGSSGHTGGTVSERDQYVHIAATWNGSDVILYKNGSQVATISTTDTITSTTNDFRLASRGDSDTRNDLLGRLDDVRMYDRVLSSDELSRLYERRAID